MGKWSDLNLLLQAIHRNDPYQITLHPGVYQA